MRVDFTAKEVALIEVNENNNVYEIVEYDKPMCYASSALSSGDCVVPLEEATTTPRMWLNEGKSPGFTHSISGLGGAFFSVEEAVHFLTYNMRYTIKSRIEE